MMSPLDPSFLNPRKSKTQKIIGLILQERPGEALKPPMGQKKAINSDQKTSNDSLLSNRNDPSLPEIPRSTPGLPCNQGQEGQGNPKPEEISPLKDSPLNEVSKKFDLETIPKGEESVKTTETPLRESYPSSELTLLPEEDEMNDGWIKLWRKLRQSRVWENPRLLKVWLWCLFRATYKERWITVRTGRGTTEVKLSPGQFIFGRKTAARELKMKPSSVRNFMQRLRNFKNLDVKQDTHYSIVSIINWETYQETSKKLDTQQDRQRTGKGHKQKLKEVKKSTYVQNPGFEAFYKAYPKHEGNRKALDAWQKLNSDNGQIEIILAAIEKQKKHKELLRAKDQFCPEWPMPATWLNGRRWEDEIQEVKPSW